MKQTSGTTSDTGFSYQPLDAKSHTILCEHCTNPLLVVQDLNARCCCPLYHAEAHQQHLQELRHDQQHMCYVPHESHLTTLKQQQHKELPGRECPMQQPHMLGIDMWCSLMVGVDHLTYMHLSSCNYGGNICDCCSSVTHFAACILHLACIMLCTSQYY